MRPDSEVRIPTAAPIDVRRTLRVLGHGWSDPTLKVDPAGGVWRAMHTADGPATFRATPGRGEVVVRAWGPGAGAVAAKASELLGVDDDPAVLVPAHAVVRALQHRFLGVRLSSGSPIMDMLIPSIIGQRVTSREAHESWRHLALACGERAPGPMEIVLPPQPGRLLTMPTYEFHRFGIEAKRAGTIVRACQAARALEKIPELGFEDAFQRLCQIRGIGPWTAAMTLAKARGWADAVPLGDHNLPSTIAWVLAGEPRGDDARMLELLAPYKGQRWRVIWMVKLGGRKAPRRGPRLSPFPGRSSASGREPRTRVQSSGSTE